MRARMFCSQRFIACKSIIDVLTKQMRTYPTTLDSHEIVLQRDSKMMRTMCNSLPMLASEHLSIKDLIIFTPSRQEGRFSCTIPSSKQLLSIKTVDHVSRT